MTTTEKLLTEAREIAYRASLDASEALIRDVFHRLCVEYDEREPVRRETYGGETLH
ncbi:hypothetical protein BER2_1692 [plant metagenome]|uniref:Uncharacterized protein n=1 Tax=plant metagenome TaxID=1297885 RepID=A0A484Q796_9ZZZZ